MTIANFIPELWAAAVQLPFEKALVYGQPTVANRDYEGEIRQQGDTVHVTTIADPTIRDYDKTTDLTEEDLSDNDLTMAIDQGDYFNFRVNDVDRVQAAGNFENPAMQRAGYLMADKVDRFLAGLGQAGVQAQNKVGRRIVWRGDDTRVAGSVSAYSVLIDLEEALNKASVPMAGRYVIVPPAFLSALLLDSRFIKANEAGTDTGLRNGLVGRALGFDVLWSNNVPTVGGGGADANDLVVQAGIPSALSFAMQILETEALRSQKRFADLVRGLQVYGGKLFRADGIATATCQFQSVAS